MLGIYIHIPFCAAKCFYCDFNSHVSERHERERYTNALCREIAEFQFGDNQTVDTIYFGGGTPTILEPQCLIRILDAVKSRFYLTKNCEISFECNPATIQKDGLFALHHAGFNRISIGMQSADDKQLKILGRIHSFSDCRACTEDAKAAGFKNLSLDLMFGIPEQNGQSFLSSLSAAVSLEPAHLSCYSLKIEQGTPFANMKLNTADDDESANMYESCVNFLNKHGYKRYEISNFSIPGFESRHNLKYWRCEDFAGFGAGAHSCVDGVRYSNIYDTAAYIAAVNEKGSAAINRIILSENDKMSEFVFLGLRTDRGILESEFEARFNKSIYFVFGLQTDKNLKRGTIVQDNGRLYIPGRYTYVSNAIMSDFVL